MIIGIAGKLGSGKDYITQNIIIPFIERVNQKILQVLLSNFQVV